MTLAQWGVWFAATFDGPFAVLIAMLAGLGLTLRFADVSVGEMFKDEHGRSSAHQFVIFGSWVFGSGILLADLQAHKGASWALFATYLAVFSGSAVVSDVVAKWDGKHPWSSK